MKLLKGITGFDTESTFDLTQLNAVLSNITQPYLKQGELKKPNESSNFYQQKIKDERTKKEFFLIANSTYFIFACVENSRCFDLRFIDFPIDLITQLKATVNSDLVVLNRKEALESVETSDLKDLAESELKQINYWKSKTVGEIIFNCYD